MFARERHRVIGSFRIVGFGVRRRQKCNTVLFDFKLQNEIGMSNLFDKIDLFL